MRSNSHNMVNSTMLSSDVTNAYDPTFASVSELRTAATQDRYGFEQIYRCTRQGGTSDASAEYFDEVVRLLEDNGITWQTANWVRSTRVAAAQLPFTKRKWDSKLLTVSYRYFPCTPVSKLPARSTYMKHIAATGLSLNTCAKTECKVLVF